MAIMLPHYEIRVSEKDLADDAAFVDARTQRLVAQQVEAIIEDLLFQGVGVVKGRKAFLVMTPNGRLYQCVTTEFP